MKSVMWVFLEIPILNAKLKPEMLTSNVFLKLCQWVWIILYWRGKEIYKQGDCIENVYYLIKGKIMFCDEFHLNLANTLYTGVINKDTAYKNFFNLEINSFLEFNSSPSYSPKIWV